MSIPKVTPLTLVPAAAAAELVGVLLLELVLDEVDETCEAKLEEIAETCEARTEEAAELIIELRVECSVVGVGVSVLVVLKRT